MSPLTPYLYSYGVGVSLFVPEVIIPFAHGVPMTDVDEGFLAGAKQFKFMRACYGICVSAAIGVIVSWLTEPEPFEKQRGLVWGTIADALHRYKGSPGREREVGRAMAWSVARVVHKSADALKGNEAF